MHLGLAGRGAVAVDRNDGRSARIGAAVDRDGERGGRGVAVGIDDGVAQRLRQRLAVLERIHQGVVVVERVGVRTVRVDDDAAVGGGERTAQHARRRAEAHGREGHCVAVVRAVAVVDLQVAADGVRARVFVDAVRVVRGQRNIVDDQHREGAVRHIAVAVGHGQCERVGDLAAAVVLPLLQGIGVAHVAGGGEAADRAGGRESGDVQHAVGGDDGLRRAGGRGLQLRQRQGRAVDADAAQAVGGADREGACARFAGVACAGEAGLVHAELAGRRAVLVAYHDAGNVVARATVGGPGDRDRELRDVGAARAVGDGIGVDLGQRLAGRQGLHARIGVVQRIGVAAVGIEHDAAVGAGERAAHAAGGAAAGLGAGAHGAHGQRCMVGVGIALPRHAAVDDVGADRDRVLHDAVRVVVGRRQVVGGHDGEGARQHVAVERRPTGVAARLHVVAVVDDDGVDAVGVRAEVGGVVAGAAVRQRVQHALHFRQRRVGIELHDQRRAVAAGDVGAGRQRAVDQQQVARLVTVEADGDAARAEDARIQPRRGGEIEVGHGAAAEQCDRRNADPCARLAVLDRAGVGGRSREHRRVVARRHRGRERARHRPLAGGGADGGADVPRTCNDGGVGDAHGQRAGRAVVVGGRHEAQLRIGRQQHRAAVGGAGRHGRPARAAVGRVLPAALCRGGGIADDRDAAEGRGRVAATRDAGLVVRGIAVAAAEQAGRGGRRRGLALLVLDAGSEHGIGPGGPVVDVGDAGRQHDRRRAVDGGAAVAGARNVHGRAGNRVGRGAVGVGIGLHQAHRELVGRAVEVRGGHEAQLRARCEHQRVGIAARAHGRPGRAVQRVLPLALRRIQRKAGDRHAEEVVGRAAAGRAGAAVVDLVGRIAEVAAEQGPDGAARGRVAGVFVDGRQRLGIAVDHDRGVVERIDGEAEGARGDQVGGHAVLVGEGAGGAVVAGCQRRRPAAGIALVVDHDGDGEGAVPVRSPCHAGRIGQLHFDGVDAAVDLGQRARDGDRPAVAGDHRAAAAAGADGGDGEAFGHRDGGGEDAGVQRVLVGHGDAGEGDAAAALPRVQVACRDVRRIVHRRREQRAVGRCDIARQPARRGRIGVDGGGRRDDGAVARVVVLAAVGAGHHAAAVAHAIVGNDLDAVAHVAVGQRAGERDGQAIEVGLNLGARAADDQGAAGAVEHAIDGYARAAGVARSDGDLAVGAVVGSGGQGVAAGVGDADGQLQEVGLAVRHVRCGAVAGDVAVDVDITDREAGHRGGRRAAGQDDRRAGCDAAAQRDRGRIVHRRDGQRHGHVGRIVGNAAGAHVVADAGACVVEGDGERHVAGIDAVGVMVEVGRAAVGEARRGAAVDEGLDVARTAGEDQQAGVVAGDRDGLAAAGRDASLRAGAADAERAAGHRQPHGDRRVEGGRLGVGDHEAAADVGGLVLDHIGARGRGERGGVVLARSEDAHRGRRNVAGDGAGGRHGGAVPVVLGRRNGDARRARRIGFVDRATVRARLEGAGSVAQPVVGNDLHLVDRVAIVAEGHGQPRERCVDLSAGAAQGQEVARAVLVAVDRHAAHGGRADGHAGIGDGVEGVAAGIEQAHDDLHEIALAGGRRVHVGVGHAEARHRVVHGTRAVDGNRLGRARDHRRIVGRRDVDPELVARLLLVAVAEAEGEGVAGRIRIGRAVGLVAAVKVVDAPRLHVRLGEGGADAQPQEGDAVGRVGDAAVGRGPGDGVLHLGRAAVGVEGREHGAGDLRVAALRHRQRVVDRGPWVGLPRVRRDLRRIVDVGDLDADRRGVRGGAPAVDGAHIEARVAQLRAVADEAQPGGAGGAGDQRRVDELARSDVGPARAAVGRILQRAAGRQRQHFDPQCAGAGGRVVERVVAAAARQRGRGLEVVLAVRVVRVGDLQLPGRDVGRAAFGNDRVRRADRDRRVIDRRDEEGEAGVPRVGGQPARAVVDEHAGGCGEPHARLEVLAGAVVLEADAAGVEIGLGEGVVHPHGYPRRAVEALQRAVPCAAGHAVEAEDGVDHLFGRHAVGRVAQAGGEVEIAAGAGQHDGAALVQRSTRDAAVVGAGIVRIGMGRGVVQGREAAAVPGGRLHQVDREIEGPQAVVVVVAGRAVVVVLAAIALDAGAVGIPSDAGGVVAHLELEDVGLVRSRAGHLHVLHAARLDVGHGEGAAARQHLAVEQQAALVEQGLRSHGDGQAVVARIHVEGIQHRLGQRHRVGAAAVAGCGDGGDQAARRVQGRIVIGGLDGQRNDRVGGLHCTAARTAAAIADRDAEAVGVGVRRRGVGVAVADVGIGQAATRPVGEDETRIDVGLRHGVVGDGLRYAADGDGAGEEQRAVRRQAGQPHGERRIGVVAAAIGDDEVADHRRRVAAAVEGIGGLAFEDDARATHGRRLVERRDVERDVGGIGAVLRRRAVVDLHREGVLRVLVRAGGGMDVHHPAVDHVLLREDRADAQARAVEQEMAVHRIGREGVHHLARHLGAERHLGIDRVQRRDGQDRAPDLVDRLRRIGYRHGVVRRRHRHIEGARRGQRGRFGVGYGHDDARAGGGGAELDIGRGEHQLVHPRIRRGHTAGEAVAAGDAGDAGGAGRGQSALRRVFDHDGDGHVAGAVVGDGPAAECPAVGARCVEAARLRHDEPRRRGADRGGGHDAVVAGIGEAQRLDVAGGGFQRPVRPARGRARGVDGRSHVGACQAGERLRELRTIGSDVAAVEQDVRIGAEARTDASPGLGGTLEAGRVHLLVAQRDLAGAAMAQDVERADAGLPCKSIGELLDAGRTGVQEDQLGTRRDGSGELLPVRDVLVHDVDLVRCARRGLQGRCRFRRGRFMLLLRRRVRRLRMMDICRRTARLRRVGRMRGRLDEGGAIEQLAALQSKTMRARAKKVDL
ncbi:hypothetical protein APY03_2177 [Variovorax sp. WDL1]|nr:hypothetical protein APY03_2177 [Variovorax sp. WDL1]